MRAAAAPFCLVAVLVGCRVTNQPPPPVSSVGRPGTGPVAQPTVVRPGAGPAAPPTAARPAPRVRPDTRQACDACRGDWGIHGIADVESCNCRTKDAGQTCRDGAQCQGQCLAGPDAKFEVVSPGPPKRGFYVGRCSEFETTFGCFRVIEAGTRERGPAVAEEAAAEICVD
jgi:hypothetical protein